MLLNVIVTPEGDDPSTPSLKGTCSTQHELRGRSRSLIYVGMTRLERAKPPGPKPGILPTELHPESKISL